MPSWRINGDFITEHFNLHSPFSLTGVPPLTCRHQCAEKFRLTKRTPQVVCGLKNIPDESERILLTFFPFKYSAVSNQFINSGQTALQRKKYVLRRKVIPFHQQFNELLKFQIIQEDPVWPSYIP